MELEQLKRRLKVPAEDETQDELLTELLADAVSFVETQCGKPIAELPAAVNKIIAKHVQFELRDNAGIASESIGGMSQSFESSEDITQSLLAELTALGLRRLVFKPFRGR